MVEHQSYQPGIQEGRRILGVKGYVFVTVATAASDALVVPIGIRHRQKKKVVKTYTRDIYSRQCGLYKILNAFM